MKLYKIHIDDLRAFASVDEWMADLPEFITTDINSYKKDDDRWRVLAGKLLLRNALVDNKTEVSISALKKTPKGRLYFETEDFDFNISHSGRLVILGWSEENRTGVDVEMHRPLGIDLFRRNFTEGEWQAITGAEDSHAIFFKAWAVKESAIKADGRGVEVLGRTEILSKHAVACDGKEWWYTALELEAGYSAAVCCTEAEVVHIINPHPRELLHP